MPSMNDAFPSRYLSAEDLRGQDHTVVIERYPAETMPARDGADERKYVLFFRGAKKGLVLDKTNAKTIASQHGNDFDGWIGKQVTIGSTWVEAFGEQTLAIRVRPGLAQGVAEAFAPPPVTPPPGIAPQAAETLSATPPQRAVDTPLGQPPLTDESVAKSDDEFGDAIPF